MKSLMNVLSSAMLAFVMVMSTSTASAAMDEDSIRNRTMPVGKVCVEGDDCGSASAAAASGPKSASDIFAASCNACHGSGVLGAPKLGDSAIWAERTAKGIDTVVQNAITGFNSMPPRGTCSDCSDDDIAATVQYMIDNSK